MQDVALVTGGTEGLGRATSLKLAAAGYRVFAGGRSAERRRALDAEARERNLPLETLELDVTSEESVARAMATIRKNAGAVDVLVNNAGIAIAAVMEEVSLEDLRKQFETNFFAVVRMTQQVLPAMRERRRGWIVNMSSVAGKISSPVFGPYSSSKQAVEAMSDALRLEVNPFGIHVILIEPGYIPTNMERASVELSSSYTHGAASSPYGPTYTGFLKLWKKLTANPRYTPEDCASVILGALRANPPKARYAVTRDAKINIFVKWLFSDVLYDRMTLRAMEKEMEGATPGGEETQAILEKMSRKAGS